MSVLDAYPPPAHPHLHRLLADVADVLRETERLAARHTVHQLTWTPDPSTWSIVQCFEHLFAVGRLYYPRLEAGLQAAKRNDADAPYTPSLMGRMMLLVVEPETRLKVPTVRAMEPASPFPPDQVLPQFIEQERELLRLIHEADRVCLNTGAFASPITRLVRFTVGDGLTIMAAHQQRHLRQAQRLTDHPDFPASAA